MNTTIFYHWLPTNFFAELRKGQSVTKCNQLVTNCYRLIQKLENEMDGYLKLLNIS